jgi:hypothetical protein
MNYLKLAVTNPMLVVSAPFLFIGVVILIVVQKINPPASSVDRLIDRIIDGSKAKPCRAVSARCP